MPRDVSFVFGGISTEYDASTSSLIHIIKSYLSQSFAERPFLVRNLYHVSRIDGLVRTIPFHSAFTIGELQAYISDTSILAGNTLQIAFETIASRNEYVVNLLHGQFGEDGGAQTLAALSGLRGTFGDPHVASLTMNKYAMSSFVSSLPISDVVRVPRTALIRQNSIDSAIQFAKSIQGPIVVKPNSLGASLFTELFHNPAASEADIVSLLRAIFKYDSTALLQEFIFGDEYSCGCLIGQSGTVPLPVVKIDTDRRFFGHAEKHSSGLAVKTLARKGDPIPERIKSIARVISSSIDFYNMVRFDFIVTKSQEVWFLECNYIPGLMKNSIFPKMLHHHGMTVIDLISWIRSNSNSFVKRDHFIKYEISQ